MTELQIGLGITELAAAVNSTPATLRNYEKLGLLHLPRDPFGRRRGGAAEIERIRAIQAKRAASRLSGLRNQKTLEE